MRQGQASTNNAAWLTEIILVGTLIVFAVFSFIINALLVHLADDPVVLAILGWLSELPFWGWLALVVALVCIVGEMPHYFAWYHDLLILRTRAIEDLQHSTRRISRYQLYLGIPLHLTCNAAQE